MRASAGAFNRYMALRFRALSWIILVCQFEIVEDRTVGPLVAVTLGGQPFERAPHRVELLCLPLKLSGSG